MSKDELESVEDYKLHLRFGKYQVRRIDKYNIVVEELRTIKEGENAGNEYPVNIGYFKRLHGALERVLQFSLESKVLKEIKDVTKALKEAELQLYKELDSKYKNIEDK